jgi:hypothetical protein
MFHALFQLAREAVSTLVERFGNGWNRFWFTPADPLPLCAVRIGVGGLALLLLASLTPDLARFFAAGGLIDVETGTLEQIRGDTAGLSYLWYLQTSVELHVAHALGMLVVLAMTVGLWTRVTAPLALVVLLSYIHRGPILASQAELVLAMALLYLAIAPCGAVWSVDWLLARRKAQGKAMLVARLEQSARPSLSAAVPLRLLQVHLALVYAWMALAKLNDGAFGDGEAYYVWWQGHAVWWLAAKPQSPLVDFAPLLADHMFVVNLWTHAILAFEIAFVLLIWNRTARPVLLLVAVPVWLSVALLTGLATFCLAMLAVQLAYVSPHTLRRLAGHQTGGIGRADGQALRA